LKKFQKSLVIKQEGNIVEIFAISEKHQRFEGQISNQLVFRGYNTIVSLFGPVLAEVILDFRNLLIDTGIRKKA
jgi:hypothetical protein